MVQIPLSIIFDQKIIGKNHVQEAEINFIISTNLNVDFTSNEFYKNCSSLDGISNAPRRFSHAAEFSIF